MQRVIERILNLLAFLLTAGRPVTADEIRYTVKGYDQPTDEAFHRTFERDKDLLRSLGVPLELRHTDVWEVEVGYVVESDDYAIDDPGLTDEERSALALAARAVRFGGRPTEMSAIFKLGGASTFAGTGGLTADLGHDLDVLGSLYGAVRDRADIEFTYRGTHRVVHPYGMLHRNGHWYLAGPETAATELVKAFRVDRMSDVTTGSTHHSFERPETFDVASTLVSYDPQPDAPKRALALFDLDVADVAVTHYPGANVVSDDGDRAVVEIPYERETSVIGWLLGFDDRVVILEPQELIDALIAHVRADV